ncbi:hypothetical protein [Robertmurraya korlensis]|uniref:hypothetical protein n=1 Tax=Robertmurraya korlensis TaxID=519977 RepID=UPI000824BB62|nr:hypothetical protein [Robertmurraya korlensis]
MKRNLAILSIFTIYLITLIGCSNEDTEEFDLNQLTRVDVQIFTGENSDNETIVTEKEKMKALRGLFARIKWEQNFKAEMARKEDVKTTLFFNFDKNMPERLFEYIIWFNQGEASATIIDRENNTLGTLEKEDAQKLRDILVNN